mgnify:CR=1 FL=1
MTALRNHFDIESIPEGTVIPYFEVSQVISCPKNSKRFRTITYRWRKIVEREHGILIGTKARVGFVKETNGGKVLFMGRKTKAAFKATTRVVQVAGIVDRKALTTEQQRDYDHQSKKASMALGTLILKRKQLA